MNVQSSLRQTGLAIAMLLCLECYAWGSCPEVPGDVTGDGDANVTDVQCAILSTLANLVGTPQPDCLPEGMGMADINCDEVASITDVQMVLGYALNMSLSVTIDANGNNCIDACEPDPLCMFGADQTAVDTVHAAIEGAKQVEQLLNQLKKKASDATCGARNVADRDLLNQGFQIAMEGVDSVAQLTTFNGTPLLNGDGNGGTTNLVLLLNEGETTLNLVPKDTASLFGSPAPVIDTWQSAVDAHTVLNQASQNVTGDIASLESDLEDLVLTTGCSVTPPQPNACMGLQVSSVSSPSPFTPLCETETPEICILELLHGALAGIDQIEELLGNLMVLTTQATCGASNPGDRQTLNTQFQEARDEVIEVIGSIQFNGTAILEGTSNGVGYTLDFLVGDPDGDPESKQIQLPALGGEGLLPSGMAINNLANAQANLSQMGITFQQLEAHRSALRAQAITLMEVFGCQSVYTPPSPAAPTAVPELMAACESCTADTQALMNTAIAGYESIQGHLLSIEAAAQTAADSGTTQAERALLDDQVAGWVDDINTVAATTTYNDIELLSGGANGWGEFIVFHLGTRNTIHNQLAHAFFNQSAWNLFGSIPTVGTQAEAQAAVTTATMSLMILQTDFESLLSRDFIAHQKMPCELFVLEDKTSPGEQCLPFGSASGCDDCALQNCQLIALAEVAYEAQKVSLNDMKALATEATSPALDDYDRSYLDTHFQDLLASLDQQAEVTEYNQHYLLLGGPGGLLSLETILEPEDPSNASVTMELMPSDTTTLMNNSWPGLYMISAAEEAVIAVDNALDQVQENLDLLSSSTDGFNCGP